MKRLKPDNPPSVLHQVPFLYCLLLNSKSFIYIYSYIHILASFPLSPMDIIQKKDFCNSSEPISHIYSVSFLRRALFENFFLCIFPVFLKLLTHFLIWFRTSDFVTLSASSGPMLYIEHSTHFRLANECILNELIAMLKISIRTIYSSF